MSTALATIKERIRAELETAKKSFEVPSRPKISLQNRKFTLPNGVASAQPIKVVIIDWRNTRTLYTGPFNPNNPQAPKCFAIAKALNDLVPGEQCADPQAASCHECPNDQWGSDPAGGKGKACKNSVRLAVVPASALDGENAQLYALDIPRTSIRNWESLVSRLSDAGHLPIEFTVEVAFSADAAYPTLIFNESAPHDRLEQLWPLYEQAQHFLKVHPAER